jgi:tetratricopeptide (TPR) repeat protein
MTYGGHPLTLDLLPPQEARRLLAARLGQDRIAAEPAAIEEIVRRCAGLPLALAIVAARAAIHPAHPLGALADELHNALGALEPAVDVRAIFSWSYQRLDEPSARLFRLVAGLHPGPEATIAAAASLAGVPIAQVAAPLAELTRANLLTRTAPDRYTCHDLLRAYAAELCAAIDADRDAARRRIVDHYVHTALAAAPHLLGHTDTITPAEPSPGVWVTDFAGPTQAMTWAEADRPALLAVLNLAADLGLDRQAGHLAWALWVFLHHCGRWHERAETQRAGLAAARRLGDPVEETRAHRTLAFALADLGRFDDAHHHLDAALKRSHDDLAGQAWTHYYRDLVYATQGRVASALAAARRAHDLFDRLGDEVGRALALTDLGWHHGRLGNHSQALDLLQQALLLHQKLGTNPQLAHTLSCLADTRLHVRDLAGAISCYRQALDLFRELGDSYGEASLLAHLGVCHHLAGDHTAARQHWSHAHALLSHLDPATTDHIHTQLTTIDKSVADTFRVRC